MFWDDDCADESSVFVEAIMMEETGAAMQNIGQICRFIYEALRRTSQIIAEEYQQPQYAGWFCSIFASILATRHRRPAGSADTSGDVRRLYAQLGDAGFDEILVDALLEFGAEMGGQWDQSGEWAKERPEEALARILSARTHASRQMQPGEHYRMRAVRGRTTGVRHREHRDDEDEDEGQGGGDPFADSDEPYTSRGVGRSFTAQGAVEEAIRDARYAALNSIMQDGAQRRNRRYGCAISFLSGDPSFARAVDRVRVGDNTRYSRRSWMIPAQFNIAFAAWSNRIAGTSTARWLHDLMLILPMVNTAPKADLIQKFEEVDDRRTGAIPAQDPRVQQMHDREEEEEEEEEEDEGVLNPDEVPRAPQPVDVDAFAAFQGDEILAPDSMPRRDTPPMQTSPDMAPAAAANAQQELQAEYARRQRMQSSADSVHDQQVSALKDNIQKLQFENLALNREIGQIRVKFEAVKQEVKAEVKQEVKDERRSASPSPENAERRVEFLNRTLDQMRNALEAQIRTLTNKNGALAGQIDQLTTALRNAERAAAAATTAIAEKEAEVQRLNATITNLRSQTSGNDAQVMQLDRELNEARRLTANLLSEKVKLIDAEARAQLEAADRAMALQREIGELRAQAAALSAQLDAARGEAQRAQQELAAKAQELAAAEAQTKQALAEHSEMSKDLAMTKGMLVQSDARIAELTRQVQELVRGPQGQRRAMDALKAQQDQVVQDLQNRLQQSQATINELNGLLGQRDRLIEDLRAQISGERSRAEAAEQRFSQMPTQIIYQQAGPRGRGNFMSDPRIPDYLRHGQFQNMDISSADVDLMNQIEQEYWGHFSQLPIS